MGEMKSAYRGLVIKHYGKRLTARPKNGSIILG
jgi:hypothetical protein